MESFDLLFSAHSMYLLLSKIYWVDRGRRGFLIYPDNRKGYYLVSTVLRTMTLQ